MALSLSRNQLLLVAFFVSTMAGLVSSQDEDDETGGNPEPIATGSGQNVSVKSGNSFQLTCRVTGYGELAIIWNKDGNTIALGEMFLNDWGKKARIINKETLEVSSADRSDAGHYSCEIPSEIPFIQHHYVTIVAMPRIMIKPSSPIIAREGQSITLQCLTDATPSKIEWFYTTIEGMHPPKKSSSGDLKITRVNEKNSGSYKCQATIDGRLFDAIAEIIVQQPPGFVNKDNSTIDAHEGADVVLECKVKGYPLPDIAWYFNDSKKSISIADTLKISNVKPDNAGYYKCVLDNNTATSKTILLRLLNPPKITAQNKWEHTGEGRTSDIACIVQANPPALVYWFHNNSVINPSPNKIIKKQGNKHSLQIRNVKPNDLGNYTCWGNNTYGFDADTIILSGIAAPVNVQVSKTADLAVNIVYSTRSYTPIIMFLLKHRNVSKAKKQKLKNDDWSDIAIPAEKSSFFYQSIYVLRDLEPSTEYEIIMMAENMYGWSYPSAALQFSLPSLVYTGVNYNSSSGSSEENMQSTTLGTSTSTVIFDVDDIHKDFSTDDQQQQSAANAPSLITTPSSVSSIFMHSLHRSMNSTFFIFIFLCLLLS